MGLVSGGHNDVLAGRQAEALRHLAHVDIGSAPSLGGVVQEEVLLQVLLVAVHLREGRAQGASAPREGYPVLLTVLLQGVLLPNSLVTHFIVTTYQLPMPKASNSSTSLQLPTPYPLPFLL